MSDEQVLGAQSNSPLAIQFAALAATVGHALGRADEDRKKIDKIYDTVTETDGRTKSMEKQLQEGGKQFERHEAAIKDLTERVVSIEAADETQTGYSDKIWGGIIALVSAALGAAIGTIASGIHFVAGKWH